MRSVRFCPSETRPPPGKGQGGDSLPPGEAGVSGATVGASGSAHPAQNGLLQIVSVPRLRSPVSLPSGPWVLWFCVKPWSPVVCAPTLFFCKVPLASRALLLLNGCWCQTVDSTKARLVTAVVVGKEAPVSGREMQGWSLHAASAPGTHPCPCTSPRLGLPRRSVSAGGGGRPGGSCLCPRGGWTLFLTTGRCFLSHR